MSQIDSFEPVRPDEGDDEGRTPPPETPSLDQSGSSKAGDSFPERLPSVPLPPGLHLMKAGTGRGKTVSAIALAFQWRAAPFNHRTLYRNVMEPRGEEVMITAVAPKAGGQVGEKGLGSPAGILPYGEWLVKRFEEVLALPGLGVPVLIVDSLTYLLKALPETVQALGTDRGPTFKEGLAYSDILGVLHHTFRAQRAGVALVGVVNESLMPVVGSLLGAAEGHITVRSPGSLVYANRSTARSERTIEIDNAFIQQAKDALGYKEGGDEEGLAGSIRF